MYEIIEKLVNMSVSRMSNTKGELGTIISISPIKIKLDLDDVEDFLESFEIMIPQHIILTPQDVGKRCVVMLTENGKYVMLGVV